MTAPTRIRQAQPRRVHLVLRDGTMIEGHILIGEDQALASYLNGRRGGWMNMTRAHRPKLSEAQSHIIVQSEHIIMATAPDHDMQIATAPSAGVDDRNVEIVLIGGKTIRGFVTAASQQRLSDYLGSQTGKFMWLQRATLAPDGRALGDLALHMGAIELMKDLGANAPLDEGASMIGPAA